MNIPKYARYEFCSKKAFEFLEEFNITTFPVNIEYLIHKNKWGLVKYSELMNEFNCDLIKVIHCLGSKDGFTTWDGENYTISYNDDNTLGDRTKFTLMHEIGHIYLNHLIDFEATQIYRGSLTESENKVLENEANAFARNVLLPAPIFLQLQDKSITNISQLFGISPSATKTRINFIDIDIKIIRNLNLSQRYMLFYYKLRNKQKCSICNAQHSIEYGYCTVCGKKNTLEWGDTNNMKYPLLPCNEKGKLNECPICDNEETNIDGDYCHICGNNLINQCSNNSCSNQDILPSNARFCPICGESSSFFKDHLLKEWNYNKYRNSPGEFLEIPDGIDEELPFN